MPDSCIQNINLSISKNSAKNMTIAHFHHTPSMHVLPSFIVVFPDWSICVCQCWITMIVVDSYHFSFFCCHFHLALPAACCDNIAWQLPPRHHSRCHTSTPPVDCYLFSSFLLPLSTLCCPLPATTMLHGSATTPPLTQPLLQLIVTFILFLLPLPLCAGPCLLQRCRMVVAAMPPFTQPHLR